MINKFINHKCHRFQEKKSYGFDLITLRKMFFFLKKTLKKMLKSVSEHFLKALDVKIL